MKMTTTLFFLRAACVLAAVGIAGCASHPAPPAWQSNARSGMEAYVSAYLGGDSAIADVEFARARADIASTGRPDLVARAELVRCAAHVASLEFDDCPGFAALAQDATAEERAYAAYLAGRAQASDAPLLPEQHRAVLAPGAGADGKGVLAAIQDPLARLVAAGVLLKTARLTPADIAAASDTASAQGWRRPLLAWLGVEAKRARDAGDEAALAKIERRIALAAKPLP